MNRVEKAYAEVFGEEKLLVQKTLAKAFYPCCGEAKGGAHHAACAKFVPDEQPAVIDGQESLL